MIPDNEMGVVVLFSQQATNAGFTIEKIGSSFPDALIKYRDCLYRVEFEYISSNFNRHGHDPMGCDLVICWIHDDSNILVPVIELSNRLWVECLNDIPLIWQENVEYWKRRAADAEKQLKTALSMQSKYLEELRSDAEIETQRREREGERTIEEVLRLWKEGNGIYDISKAVFGHSGGNQYKKIRAIVESFD